MFTCVDVFRYPFTLLVSDILPVVRSALFSSMIQIGPTSRTMNRSVAKDTLKITSNIIHFFFYRNAKTQNPSMIICNMKIMLNSSISCFYVVFLHTLSIKASTETAILGIWCIVSLAC